MLHHSNIRTHNTTAEVTVQLFTQFTLQGSAGSMLWELGPSREHWQVQTLRLCQVMDGQKTLSTVGDGTVASWGQVEDERRCPRRRRANVMPVVEEWR